MRANYRFRQLIKRMRIHLCLRAIRWNGFPIAKLLILLAVLPFAVTVQAQCDFFGDTSCISQPPCQGTDCSLTPSVPPPGVSSNSPPGNNGPHGPQSTPDNPSAHGPTAAQNRAAALNAATAPAINSLTLQASPDLDNTIVITNTYTQQWDGVLSDDGRLPSLEASATSRLPAHLIHSEPIAGDGEFVVDETDLTLPGEGIPFVFARHYRSGVDYQTPLGFGWNHTFNQRVIVLGSAFSPGASSATLPDILLLNDRLEQLRFAFNSTSPAGDDVYVLQSPGTMTFRRQHGVQGAPWRLDDGSNLIYRFDGNNGELESVSDAAAHTIRIQWTAGSGAVPPRVAQVTDTTGRVIYFVYQYVDQMTFWPAGNPTWVYQFENDNIYAVDQAASVGPTGYQYLACLSLTTSCGDSNTLLSFKVTPITATSDPVRYVETYARYPLTYRTVSYTYEFDLTQVLDSRNTGPTYKYYRGPDKTYLDPRLYQKEFDTYWPSQYAQQLYQTFQKQIPALQAMCPSLSQAAVDEADTLLAPENSLCATSNFSCIAKEVDNLDKKCVKAIPGEVKALKSRISSVYQYGTPPQLYHNLIEIDDADGRIVIQNTYGQDTSLPDFDRVNQQILGGDANNTTTYSYVDGANAGAFALQSPFSTFYPVDICPRQGGGYGPIVQQPLLHSDAFQTPTLEIIAKGPLGRTNTMYVDANGEMLRSSDTAGVATNYNYSAGGPSGILYSNGQRSCVQYDTAGRVSAVSQIPGAGLLGDIIDTAFTYDSSEELTDETQTVSSAIVSDRSILRDAVEQIIGVGDAVDATHAQWTCYQYTDAAPQRLGGIQPLSRERATEPQGPTPANSPNPAGPVHVPFNVSPCQRLFPGTTLAASYAAIPSHITRPDGTEVALNNITPTGPGEIIVDAAGTAPLDRYFVYDNFGRLNETGLRDFVSRRMLPATVEKWDFDLEGVLQDTHVPDATTPSQLLTTTYGYDKSRNLTSVDDPLLHRAFTTDVFGNTLTAIETPKGGAGASGAVRNTCTTYNAYSQPSELISPEGNVYRLHVRFCRTAPAITMGPA